MPKKSDMRFSIVIPCFDEEDYLGATLESLKQQDYKGIYEIIVVDNNCTDNTLTIAQKYGALIISESHPGVCWARQAGTKAARGEIIVSTDADTTFDKDWLTNIDQQLLNDPQLVAICAPCEFVNAPWWGTIYPILLFGGVRIFYLITRRPFYISATNTAFKKSVWEGYDTSLTQGGDELSLLHMLRRKGKVAFTLKYKVHTSSRRLDNGLWYNVFVSFFFYYIGAYYINRLFKRTIIGSAPAYRQKFTSAKAITKFAKKVAVSVKVPERSKKEVAPLSSRRVVRGITPEQ
jgi:glycosyltransferase involved in cell wall biosynthesis